MNSDSKGSVEARLWLKRLFTIATFAIGIYLLMRANLGHFSPLTAALIPVLLIALSFTLVPIQTRNFFVRFFGKIEYIQITSHAFEERIRTRYQSESEPLTSLGFNLLFFEASTFPLFRLLLIFPAIVVLLMLWKPETMTIHQGSKILIGHPVFGSRDKTTYAQILGLGVMFHTLFKSPKMLVSRTYGSDEFNLPTYVRHSYAGASISDVWAAHQESIQAIEVNGDSVDRDLNFETFVEIIR